MKKLRFILAITGIIMTVSCAGPQGDHGFAIKPCVSGQTARSMAKAAMPVIAGEGKSDRRDMVMQVVYQLARRSIVKVTAKDAAGSGIIWKADDDIVVVSNRHLLMKDVVVEVSFGNGVTVAARVAGYSQQYDIGFLKIPRADMPDSVMRGIYEAVPVLYGTLTDGERAAFAGDYAGKGVMQLGFSDFSTGTVGALNFVPLFNTFVLETDCYSRAGMSGGGVFDAAGRLLGMISGGDVPEDAKTRESELTYSIPPALIETEYNALAIR